MNVRVSGTQGAVHTGSGNLFSISLARLGGRSRREQAVDELRWLAQRFVYPFGFGKARDILETHRTVFLDAPPGSGRVAAARMLLWELRAHIGKFHELLPQEKDENETRLNPSHIDDGDGVWLDLSEVDTQLWTEIHAELSSLRASVHEHGAHLVVVLPHDAEDLRPEYSQYRVQIKPPPASEVLSRWLQVEGIPHPPGLPQLQFLDKNRPLRETPKYVELITAAREMAAGGGNFVTWSATAYSVLSGRDKEVADLVTSLKNGPQRALLLAAAMLHGAHADSVQQAADSLLLAVKHPPDECPVLERTALDQRLREIRAELDASGNVQFEELGYDSTIRAYLWTHMPELHDHIRTWVRDTADSTDLIDNEREHLVRRFTEQCLNDRYRSTWVSLVEQWTAEPTTGRQMNAAALVLQRGLQDEKSGRIFRRQIYEWSRISNLSSRLAEVIIAVCRDQMALTHPDEALVRLHHIARRESRTRAREALIVLVAGDRRFLRQMLNRLADRNPEARRWPVGVDLFLELADPVTLTDPGTRNHPLIDESTVRRQLADGWSFVFADLPHDAWRPRVTEWLRHAANDAEHRDVLLDVLVAGSDQRTGILARLYVMTRGPELGAVISDLILEKMNVAQNIQFA